MKKILVFVLLMIFTLIIFGCQQKPTAPAAEEPVISEATVNLLSAPTEVEDGKSYELTWGIKGGQPGVITHTAVHFGDQPGAEDISTYPSLTPPQTGQSPQVFTSILTVPTTFRGTLYLRAHAVVDGKNIFDAETSLPIVEVKTTVSPTPPTVTPTTREIQVTARRFEFEPSVIEVKKGDKVKLIITSTDVTHGFSLPEFGIDKQLPPGVPVTVEFTADKAGTFDFFCSVPCGSGHSSMRGTLNVKE